MDSPEDQIKALEAMGDVRNIRELVETRAEQNSPQLAFSIDGRTFGFEAKMSLRLPIGCYITLTVPEGSSYLGQVMTKQVVTRDGPEFGVELNELDLEILPPGLGTAHFKNRVRIRTLEGTGVLLGIVHDDRIEPTHNTDIFQRATIDLAASEVVGRYLSTPTRKTSGLAVGSALYVDGDAPIQLNAAGFNRHTFLCGQSGSGKTFSLGIMLEQLLLNTSLRLVIIDPNSDFVSLGQVREDDEINRLRSEPLSAKTLARLKRDYQGATESLKVFRAPDFAAASDTALKLRFGDLERHLQATVLELDPLKDREEYNTFWKIVGSFETQDYALADVRSAISHDYTAEARKIGLRVENLGVADWDIWSTGAEPSFVDTLERDDWRALVFDIGTLDSAREKAVVTNALLGHFWRHRNNREPVLIVIDEAHNVCPQEPADDLQGLSTEEMIRIAGEGRKFGLYLLLASQRPSKLHANVLSQCDNLVLMRMNSSADLQHLSGLLSQVPASLLEQSTKFSQGESLIAGRLVQNPSFVKFEGRLSVEGGSDVPTSWAAQPKPRGGR